MKKVLSAVWRDAVRDSELDATAKLVALVLSTYMDRRGTAWPARPTIACGAGLGERTIDGAVSRLERAGFLEIQRTRGGRGKTNTFIACLPETAQELRRSEWETAQFATQKGAGDDVNTAGAAPESIEGNRKRGGGTLKGAPPLDECAGCGERRTLVDEHYLYCTDCFEARSDAA